MLIHGLARPLDSTEQRLVDTATDVARRLPVDGTYLNTVASAVVDVHGVVSTGVNVGHFTGGPCAELVALGVAAGAGSGPVAAIVAVGDDGRGVMPPCGRCRQVLLDQHPDCRVVVPDAGGLLAVPVRALLPYPSPHPDARPPRLLRFSARHWQAVVDGAKTATMRLGDRVAPGPVTMLFEFEDRYRSLPGMVESAEPIRFADIDDTQAAAEGCSADELRASSRAYDDPGIGDEDLIYHLRFRADQPD